MMINYSKEAIRDTQIGWFEETEKKLAECLPAIDAAAYNIAQYDDSLWKKDCPLKQLEDYRRVVGRCCWLVCQMQNRLMQLHNSYTFASMNLGAYEDSRKEDDE